MSRQSRPAPSVEPSDAGNVQGARERLSQKLRDRLHELGVPEKKWGAWLEERTGVRWQTAQHWFNGTSFPLGQNLAKIAKALDMRASDLLGTIREEAEPQYASWRAFLVTPEGASMTEEEKWSLRLFSWVKDPTVGDYRALLAVLRQNAER